MGAWIVAPLEVQKPYNSSYTWERLRMVEAPFIPEEIIFQDGDVNITRTLVKVGEVSYPVNGIGSVLIQKPSRINLILFSVAFFVFGVIMKEDSENFSNAGAWLISLGIVLGVVAFLRPAILVLRTASGDQQALKSKNVKKLVTVKEAVERAVALRG